MAHYAFLDKDNIVTQVIVGVDEDVVQTDTDGTEVGGSSEAWETFYGNVRGQTCKRTSYNGNYRKNYAGLGYTFDSARDAFIPPKPFPSWVLNEDTCLWDAPVPCPEGEGLWVWNEDTLNWIEQAND
jgi:hypothetical protein